MTEEDGDGKPAAEPGAAPEAIVVAGRGAGKTLREIAIDLFGAEGVDAEWHADGWMRARVQRLRRSGLQARRPPAPAPEPGGQAGGRDGGCAATGDGRRGR